MGTNVLTEAVANQIIPPEHHNELVEALLQIVPPRDGNRLPSDLAGQLGSSLYRWAFAYINDLRIGTASNSLKMYEGSAGVIYIENGNVQLRISTTTLEVWISGTKRFDVTSSGINWTTQAAKSIPTSKIANKNFEQSAIDDASEISEDTVQSFSFTFEANRYYMVAIKGAHMSNNQSNSSGRITLEVGSDTLESFIVLTKFSDTVTGPQNLSFPGVVPCNVEDTYLSPSAGTRTVRVKIENMILEDFRLLCWEI